MSGRMRMERVSFFADFDPPQTLVLRADEILGRAADGVEFWASAASVATTCDSISRADHAAPDARPPPVHGQGPPSRSSNGTPVRNMRESDFEWLIDY